MAASSVQTNPDSHVVYERLVDAGCARAQAHVHSEIFRMIFDIQKNIIVDSQKHLATKDDLNKLSNRMSEIQHSMLRWQIGIAIAIIGMIKFLK